MKIPKSDCCHADIRLVDNPDLAKKFGSSAVTSSICSDCGKKCDPVNREELDLYINETMARGAEMITAHLYPDEKTRVTHYKEGKQTGRITPDRPLLIRPWDDKEEKLGNYSYLYVIDGREVIMPARIQIMQEFDEDSDEVIYYTRQTVIDKQVKALSRMGELPCFDEVLPHPNFQIRVIQDKKQNSWSSDLPVQIIKCNLKPHMIEEKTSLNIDVWQLEKFEGLQDTSVFMEWVLNYDYLMNTPKLQKEGLQISPFQKVQTIERLEEILKKSNREDFDSLKELYAHYTSAIEKNTFLQIPLTEGYGKTIMDSYSVFVAFSLFLKNLKPDVAEYKTGRKNLAKTAEGKAFKFDQDIMSNRVRLLTKGQTKTRATGKGGEHSYRYNVRGHERYVGEKFIWVKAHERGVKYAKFSPQRWAVDAKGKAIVLAKNLYSDLRCCRITTNKLKRFKHLMWRWFVKMWRSDEVLYRK